MQLTNLLRFDYWLDPSVTSQPAGRAIWLLVVAGLIGCLVVWLLWRAKRLPRETALAWVIASGLVGFVALGRILAVPVLGWRVGWLLAGVIALTPIIRRLAGHIREDALVRDCLDTMAFTKPHDRDFDWHPSTAIAWLLYNLLGLTILFANIALPLWIAPWLLLVLLAPLLIAFALRLRRGEPLHLWQLSSLTPLTITYLTALIGALGIALPGVLNGVLFAPLSLIVMSAFSFAISCRWSVAGERSAIAERPFGGDLRFVRAGAALLIIVTIAWAAWAALTLRTHGVTGSDPYAYAQMGVDLATRGTVFHPFPLVEITYALDIPSYPITHVGYRIPTDAARESTTVWPPGYAVFTGLAYLVGGETGLYLITPLLNLIALGVVGWFTWLIVSRVPPLTPALSPLGRGGAAAVAALTVMLTATSYQQVEWQMIPMADIAAQIFSLLAIGLALTARGSKLKAILSGLCIGIAFSIRYTQVLIAPAAALALLLDDREQITDYKQQISSRLWSVLVCALAAAFAALTTLIYHHNAFGSWLTTGSEELGNFSLTLLPQTLWRTLGELNHYREFGLLTPLIAIGLIAMWRQHRRALAVLAVYFVITFGFHVAYAYLRLRDILFLFPVISLLAALGTVELWRWVSAGVRDQGSGVSRLLATTVICTLSFVFVLRAMETLALPVTRGFAAFGYLVREQRVSFDRLAELTPPDAVIGATLNSGAIDLHSGRQTFRPDTWTPEQLSAFTAELMRRGVPVFVVHDSNALNGSLMTLRATYLLEEVGRINIPYYQAIGGGSGNRLVPVYRVISKR
jgi:hypothetical protein